MKKRIIPLLIAILAACPAWAAPSISGVSGTASGGEAITISGSDFGNGPSIVIFDDFEKGANILFVIRRSMIWLPRSGWPS